MDRLEVAGLLEARETQSSASVAAGPCMPAGFSSMVRLSLEPPVSSQVCLAALCVQCATGGRHAPGGLVDYGVHQHPNFGKGSPETYLLGCWDNPC